MIEEYSFDFNRLMCLSPLGEGSFSDNFIVKDEDIGTIFKAKIFHSNFNEEINKDILNQIKCISKLNHPLLSKFIGYNDTNFLNDPKPVIVSELISNGSLNEFIYSTMKGDCGIKYDDTHKLITMYGISAAMSFLHSKSIIHSHLNPNNIFIDQNNNSIISDYYYTIFTRQNIENLINSPEKDKNTIVYLAPEIFSTSQFTQKSDVYSFGMISYKILSNKDPFENLTSEEIIEKVQKGERPEFNFQISEPYRLLIEKCWSQNPDERPSFDQIVIEFTKNKDYITETINKSKFTKYCSSINRQLDKMKKKNKDKTVAKKNKDIKKAGADLIDLVSSKKEGPKKNSLKTSKKQSTQILDMITIYDLPLTDSMYNIKIDQETELIHLITSKNGEQTINSKILDISTNRKQTKSSVQFALPENDDEINGEWGNLYKAFEKREKRRLSIIDSNPQRKNLALSPDTKKSKTKTLHNKSKSQNQPFNVDKKSKKDDDHVHHEKIKKVIFDENVSDEIINLKKEADSGVKKSMLKYGMILLNGNGIQPDKSKGLQYIEKAAKENDKEAIIQCANIYYQGEFEIEINKGKAAKYFKKAAFYDDVESMYRYALILYEGDGVPINKIEACEYFKQAAMNGHVESMVRYAKMLHYNDGLEDYNGDSSREDANKIEASKYYKKAIEKDSTEAMYQLSIMHYKGDHIKKDKRYSALLCKMAADKGHVEAMFEYAIKLLKGEEISIDKKASANYFKKAADNGHVDAMYRYSLIRANGIGVNVRKDEAAIYCKMAADHGHIESMYLYSLKLKTGDGVKVDHSESSRYCKMAADKGFVDAIYKYGKFLSKGEGVTQNTEEAIRYLKQAAEKGQIDSYYDLYMLLKSDEDTERNSEALKYFKLAINNDQPDALYLLGTLLYDNGEYIRAASTLKMAADNGHVDAMLFYANMLNEGEKIESNKEEAIKYYRIAAENSKFEAMHEYALLLLMGDGVKQDLEEAAHLFGVAASHGFIPSMFNYAMMLLKGKGIDCNKKQASEYFQKAADKGDAESAKRFYKMIDAGEGIPIDHKMSAVYCKIAADNGDIESMYIYGLKCIKGEGVAIDYKVAVKYFKNAADRGKMEAYLSLAQILEIGKGVKLNKKEAAYIYKNAADNGHVESMFTYANKLYDGDGIDQNKREAARYYRMAANKGHKDATLKYTKMLKTGDGIYINMYEYEKYIKMVNE